MRFRLVTMDAPSFILTIRNIRNLEETVGTSLLKRCQLFKQRLNVVPRRSTLRLRAPSPYLWLSLSNKADYDKLSRPEAWSFLEPVQGKIIQVQKVVRGKWPLYIHDVDVQLSSEDIVKIFSEHSIAVCKNIPIRTFRAADSPTFSCVLSVVTEHDYNRALEQRMFADSLEVTSFLVEKCRANKPIYEQTFGSSGEQPPVPASTTPLSGTRAFSKSRASFPLAVPAECVSPSLCDASFSPSKANRRHFAQRNCDPFAPKTRPQS